MSTFLRHVEVLAQEEWCVCSPLGEVSGGSPQVYVVVSLVVSGSAQLDMIEDLFVEHLEASFRRFFSLLSPCDLVASLAPSCCAHHSH